MRDLMAAAIALVMAMVAGLALGWHWRGAQFEREAERLRAEIVARETAKRDAIERALAEERSRASVAERAAEAADRAKAEAVEALSWSSAGEVEIVNGQIGEVFR